MTSNPIRSNWWLIEQSSEVTCADSSRRCIFTPLDAFLLPAWASPAALPRSGCESNIAIVTLCGTTMESYSWWLMQQRGLWEAAEANSARPSYKAGDNVLGIDPLSPGWDHPSRPSLSHMVDTGVLLVHTFRNMSYGQKFIFHILGGLLVSLLVCELSKLLANG